MSPGLLLGACVWLLVSWLINASIDSAALIGRDAIAFAPAARGLLISMALGGLLIWPAWRLSQPTPRLAGAHVGVDLLCLLLLAQIVVWPLRFGAQWTIIQTAMIDLTLIIWMIAAALVVWAGWLGRSPLLRTLAMLGCLLLLLGGYAVVLIMPATGAARLTPLTMLWMLANPDPGRTIPDSTAAELLALLIAVIVGFAVLLHVRLRLHQTDRHVIMNENER